MGDARAETYLRLLAEAELRRAAGQLRGLDAAVAADDGSDPGVSPFAVLERALWKVGQAGRILVAADALDEDFLACLAADLYAATKIRSRIILDSDRVRGRLHAALPPSSGQPLPSHGSVRAMRVTPIGRALPVASDRAPSTLHLMSLVRTRTEAVITVVMRMHWPSDGSSTDLEITGAGPHHLPYDEFRAVDDQGTRYAVRFEDGEGGTATWRGLARLSPVPSRGSRRLDLVGDGTPLIRLSLGPPAPRGRWGRAGPAAIPPGERLLAMEAERILASGQVRGPVEGPDPGEIITVLTKAGAVAADSPVPGQLAALCQRLGAAGHGIDVPPGPVIPAQWASVIAQRDSPAPADGHEAFAPLADVLPDVDGARFALAGLSTAAGQSHLHVVSYGTPWPSDRFAHHWTYGFSWWLRDGAGNWHVAAEGEPYALRDGAQAFRLRLTPPLVAVADTAEVVVTGPTTRVRATVPILPAAGPAAGT